ncbi:unnamed protein product [Ilex paraguariensis]|uniref:Uncharacterized protein n=1 Tax=Ilex paraguariensis TaxID=185542 RepID=A0ABC8SWG7_9AQUA
MKILAHSFDQSLGGRDFDEVLFRYFAMTFKEEYKTDVFQNARACIRLRAACEKLKKVLSANAEAPLNIECLMEEKDVKGCIQREKFEQLSVSLLSSVTEPLEKALLDVGLSVTDIHVVEVIGSGSRFPAVTRRLKKFFGKESSHTMKAIECVAKGCALQCAIVSPTFKVRQFQLLEKDVEVPFVKESAKEATEMEIDEASADGVPPSSIMENDVTTGAGNVLVAENGVSKTRDMPVQMRTYVEVSKHCFK